MPYFYVHEDKFILYEHNPGMIIGGFEYASQYPASVTVAFSEDWVKRHERRNGNSSHSVLIRMCDGVITLPQHRLTEPAKKYSAPR